MRYDVFISHSSINAKLAEHIVDELENKGLHCFIAPRNMTVGADYASELVENISECPIFLFLFTNESNKSGMVIREVNEAVTLNKYIITLKIDNVEPNKSLRFYLSVNHWLNVSNPVNLNDIEIIFNTIIKALSLQSLEKRKIHYEGYHVLTASDLINIGYSYKQINISCLNIDFDYLKKEDLSELIDAEIAEQEWLDNFEMFPDLSNFLVYDDEIIGYYTLAFVNDSNVKQLIDGEILSPQMFEYYEFGGVKNVYVTFFPIRKAHSLGQNYKALIDDFFKKVYVLSSNNDIKLNQIVLMSYSNHINKALNALGIRYITTNSAKGALYIINRESLYSSRLNSLYTNIQEVLI